MAVAAVVLMAVNVVICASPCHEISIFVAKPLLVDKLYGAIEH